MTVVQLIVRCLIDKPHLQQISISPIHERHYLAGTDAAVLIFTLAKPVNNGTFISRMCMVQANILRSLKWGGKTFQHSGDTCNSCGFPPIFISFPIHQIVTAVHSFQLPAMRRP